MNEGPQTQLPAVKGKISVIRLFTFTQNIPSLSQRQSPVTCFHVPSPMVIREGKAVPNGALLSNLSMILRAIFPLLKIGQKRFLIIYLDQLVQLQAGAGVNN